MKRFRVVYKNPGDEHWQITRLEFFSPADAEGWAKKNVTGEYVIALFFG